MKTTISALLFSMLGLAAFSAHAAGECDRYRSEYDKTYCFSKLFLQSDAELNQVYDDLNKLIKPAVKQELKETEASWIQYRDGSCSSGGTIDVDCNYRVNRERTEYLRDRLRECKTGTCRNGEIVKPSWK
ncbi:lysozyme inhibitor LprI family protein [Paraburkholderia sp. J76]|uniref:lysozyme inhibitor LprI family protein n=1 Tax=Paraburkholderia sp. J76 TaxID=2805439 RepID=UPI002ABE7714|nr:lysozyme inhibitor LprI family protein [Paraburkholderia sp. J76]